MTANQKANELVDKFINQIWNDTAHHMNTLVAKNCAIIAVDEILRQSNSYAITKYWIDVKTEIENL